LRDLNVVDFKSGLSNSFHVIGNYISICFSVDVKREKGTKKLCSLLRAGPFWFSLPSALVDQVFANEKKNGEMIENVFLQKIKAWTNSMKEVSERKEDNMKKALGMGIVRRTVNDSTSHFCFVIT
jgi:hypothetical protein